MSVRLRARSGKARPGGLFGMRLAAQAAPARSPTRPPIGYWRWVAGWGSGPVPPPKSLFRDFPNSLSGHIGLATRAAVVGLESGGVGRQLPLIDGHGLAARPERRLDRKSTRLHFSH